MLELVVEMHVKEEVYSSGEVKVNRFLRLEYEYINSTASACCYNMSISNMSNNMSNF